MAYKRKGCGPRGLGSPLKQVGPGGKVTKKMVEDESNKKFIESANMANDAARAAETGIGDNGFPLTASKRANKASYASREKKNSAKISPAYNNVGLSIPGGKSPLNKKYG